MAEPTLSLTFEDLIIRVAEHVGVADFSGDTAAAPTDTYNLSRVKRIINDAYRMFYNEIPNWNWSLQRFSITFDVDGTSDDVVDASAWRYYLPDGFFQIIGPLTYEENSGYKEMKEVQPSKIEALRAESDTSGYPVMYAIRKIAGDPLRRWELLVWPEPTSDETIIGHCRVYPNKLVENNDVPNCGPEFDEAILAACKYVAETEIDEAPTGWDQRYRDALASAIAFDRRNAPKRLGNYGGGTNLRFGQVYTGVDTYTTLDGTSYSTG